MITDAHRTFLDDLRDKGIVNMFGATPFLQEHFDLERHEARTILSKWMTEKSATGGKG